MVRFIISVTFCKAALISDGSLIKGTCTHLIHCTLALVPENIEKPHDFPVFSGVKKGQIENKWVNRSEKWCTAYSMVGLI